LSKQAVNQSRQRQQAFDEELEELVCLAGLLKEEHPGCGVEKMYYTLKPKFLGRDKFCELFLSMGFGVKKIKNYHRTTIPTHLNYPNLIEGMQLTRPYQLVQSDITYFPLNEKHYYLVFIIDVYTREIVGYCVSDSLRVEANMHALHMAYSVMSFDKGDLIHHSDRGSQYGSKSYLTALRKKGAIISMGLMATDNPYAERINGIIKNEYLNRWVISNLKDLKRKTRKAVNHYNHKRLHRGHNMKHTPIGFKKEWLNLCAHKRPKVIIYTEGKVNLIGASSPLEICPQEEPKAHNCPMELK